MSSELIRADAEHLIDALRETIAGARQVASGSAVEIVNANVPPALERLEATTLKLMAAIEHLDTPPPAPPTLRGRVGAVLVRLVRRVTAWQSAQYENAFRLACDALVLHLQLAREQFRSGTYSSEPRAADPEYRACLVAANAGTPQRPVGDVGGRWVESLRAHGLQANDVEVFCGLAACPDASLGAVTAAQVLDQLPFAAVAALLADVKRALQPGGLLLIETHSPVAPDVLLPALEARGFVNVRRMTRGGACAIVAERP